MKFEEFGLGDQILRAIKELSYEEATNIQEKCIPLVKQGRDVVGQSSTGSGKTAAFGLPILEKIEPGKGIQMLILTPTRELTIQDKDALEQFAKYLKLQIVAIFGGVGYEPQIHGMRHADILVGTPGRMLDHIRQGNMNLKGVKWLVLDEADKMFEMGFIEDVEQIISQTPGHRQTLLFSATFPSEIHKLVEKYLHDPVDVKAEIYVTKSHLKQAYYTIDQREKFSLLVHLIKHKKGTGLVMVFCATRDEVSLLTKNLEGQGINVMAIHGGLAQNKRMQALEQLKNKDIDVLVATDVAARGLDIKDVTHIFNYDVPKTSIEYIHRIGRTARAGANGEAVTLLSQRDFENFDRVLEDRSLDIVKTEPPQFERVTFHLMRPGREMHGRPGERPMDPGDRAPQDRRGGGGYRSHDGPAGGGYGGGRPMSRGPPRSGGGGYSHDRPSSFHGGPSRDGPREFGRGPRPSGPREFSRGPEREFHGSRDRDSGSGFIEISGGFGEKPKLVRMSDVGGHQGHHAPQGHDNAKPEERRDFHKKNFGPRR